MTRVHGAVPHVLGASRCAPRRARPQSPHDPDRMVSDDEIGIARGRCSPPISQEAMEWVGQFRRQPHAIGWTLSETCEIASKLLTPPRCAPDDRGAIQLVAEVRSAFADLHPGLSSIRRVLSGRQRSQDRICSRFSKFYGVIKATDHRLSTLWGCCRPGPWTSQTGRRAEIRPDRT